MKKLWKWIVGALSILGLTTIIQVILRLLSSTGDPPDDTYYEDAKDNYSSTIEDTNEASEALRREDYESEDLEKLDDAVDYLNDIFDSRDNTGGNN
jgi:cbb3-type cytochrome oxidase cytochrome c subunit